MKRVSLPFSEPNVISPDGDTGFNEPLSTERNTALLHPAVIEAPPISDEVNLKTTPAEPQRVGIVQKVKGEIKIIEGKGRHNQWLTKLGPSNMGCLLRRKL